MVTIMDIDFELVKIAFFLQLHKHLALPLIFRKKANDRSTYPNLLTKVNKCCPKTTF